MMTVVTTVPWSVNKCRKIKRKGILTILCALLYMKIMFSVLNYKPSLIYNKMKIY